MPPVRSLIHENNKTRVLLITKKNPFSCSFSSLFHICQSLFRRWLMIFIVALPRHFVLMHGQKSLSWQFFWKVIKEKICSTVSITILLFMPICLFLSTYSRKHVNIMYMYIPSPTIKRHRQLFIHPFLPFDSGSCSRFISTSKKKKMTGMKENCTWHSYAAYFFDPFYICTGLSSSLNEMKNRYENNFFLSFLFPEVKCGFQYGMLGVLQLNEWKGNIWWFNDSWV